MRLTQQKIEQILEIILGKEGIPLVQQLIGKENVSEFDLATKTKQDIKVVRKMLYILYNHNLVGFTRKKDKQKGWYIYYWTLLPESIRFSYYKMKKDHLERLQEQLDAEKKELFFICPNDCTRLNFDQAMDFEFHCPECGELISQDSSDKKIEEIQKQIIEIEEELGKITQQRQERRKEVKERKKEVKEKKRSERKKKSSAAVTKKATRKISSTKQKGSKRPLKKK